jgi:hypothetical protein
MGTNMSNIIKFPPKCPLCKKVVATNNGVTDWHNCINPKPKLKLLKPKQET